MLFLGIRFVVTRFVPPAPFSLRSAEFAPDEVQTTRYRWWTLRGMGLAYGMLIVGLAVTALLTLTFLNAAKERNAFRIAQQATETQNRFATRLARQMTALLGGAALFAGDAKLRPEEFENFGQRLRKFGALQGVQSIGFTPRVAGNDLTTYVTSVSHRLGRFKVWPQSYRDEHFPIELFEPLTDANRSMLGFDMRSDPALQDAMDRARDSGEPAASGPVPMPGNTSAMPGFVIFAPTYLRGVLPSDVQGRRGALVGFVYAFYADEQLLRGVLSEAETMKFQASFHNGAAGDPLRQSADEARTASVSARTFDIGGRELTLQLRARGPYQSPWDATLALGASLGVLVSSLVFTVIRIQVEGRQEAVTYASRIKEARSEALANLRTRETFLSAASHELKTPLTALNLQVEGLSNILAEGHVYDPAKLQRRLGSIARQAERLSILVDDLLEVAEVSEDSVTLVIELVDLETLILTVARRFSAAARRVGSEIRYEPKTRGVAGLWDQVRLEKVIASVLANALKYGPGKPITITVAREGDLAEIRITDEGMGIAPDDQIRIFDRFERAISSKHFGGMGLGLWLSREVVTALGGTISVTSQPGQGATFSIKLPMGATLLNAGQKSQVAGSLSAKVYG